MMPTTLGWQEAPVRSVELGVPGALVVSAGSLAGMAGMAVAAARAAQAAVAAVAPRRPTLVPVAVAVAVAVVKEG